MNNVSRLDDWQIKETLRNTIVSVYPAAVPVSVVGGARNVTEVCRKAEGLADTGDTK